MGAFHFLVICVVFVSQISVLLADERLRSEAPRRLRVLAFHGHDQSAAVFQKEVAKWDSAILERLELTFLNGCFQLEDGSYEWYHSNEDLSRAYNYEECIVSTLDYIGKEGPFDGLFGHSQGGIFAGLLSTIQFRGREINGISAANLPPIRFVISSMGSYLRDPAIVGVYSGPPIDIPLLEIMGLKDSGMWRCEEAVSFFKDPVVIYVDQPHSLPIFGAEDVQTVVNFLKKVQNSLDRVSNAEVFDI